jgi:hypothetical protein
MAKRSKLRLQQVSKFKTFITMFSQLIIQLKQVEVDYSKTRFSSKLLSSYQVYAYLMCSRLIAHIIFSLLLRKSINLMG